MFEKNEKNYLKSLTLITNLLYNYLLSESKTQKKKEKRKKKLEDSTENLTEQEIELKKRERVGLFQSSKMVYLKILFHSLLFYFFFLRLLDIRYSH